MDPSPSKPISESRCAICLSYGNTSLLFQGELSDYYYCSQCKSWYEVFLKSRVTIPIRDPRRIRALEYFFSPYQSAILTAFPLRSFLSSLYHWIQDLYFWAYRRFSG